MYTTGDLDKSTHKKLMYVGSQHMSGDGNEKRKRCRITNRFKKKKKKKLSKFYTVSKCK